MHNVKCVYLNIFKGTVLVLSPFTLLCNHYHHLDPEYFSSCKIITLKPLNNNSPFLSPHSPWHAPPTFYLYELIIGGISCAWDSTVFAVCNGLFQGA